ncbi:hypothetical protein JD844_004875 [Phrynosoma platyrhinos]|uniref:Anaphylatoxin-like domain-containing protein n=1 Tax=Phrynosoma platyrhinos TaxID=52577 RepID=A0ABQ7SDV2_PHRPL|nr:hypothetical protein JD844_004875 [Phrynosoma platyrhinos]
MEKGRLQPKDLSSKDPKTSVQYVYLEAVSPHFTKEKKMPVTYDNGFLFVQTDKPVYTPDQTVKVRVYSLNEELRPARRAATLTFVDPEEVEVDIIKEEDVTGIISFPDFKIPPYPKYFYNAPVSEAQVFVRFGIIEGTHKTMMPKALRHIEMEEGIAEFYFNSKSAVSKLSYNSLEELDGLKLYIAASVLETKGGHSEDSELTSVMYVMSPYKLNLVATPFFVKPGLPYFIKVQVKDPVGVPARNLPVVLTASVFNEAMEETTLVQEGTDAGRRETSSNDGTASFVLNIPLDAKVLEFRIKTADAQLPEENQASEAYEAKSYISLSGSYLYIDWASNHKTLHVGNTLHIGVHPSSHYIDKIHHYSYLIISKGKIITYGTQPKLEGYGYQTLQFQITQEMVPSARILVYYIVTGEGAAELVADSVWLNVEQKCGNSLEANEPCQALVRSTRSTQRNEMDKLDIACQAILRAAPSTVSSKIEELVSLVQHPMVKDCCRVGAQEYPVKKTCNERLKNVKGGPRCMRVFQKCCNCAELLRSNDTHKNTILGRSVFVALFDLDPVVRSYFPESWLWEVHPVSSSKTLPVTLPDSLTTWEIQGISISDQGICVADALQVQYCTSISVDKGICLSGTSSSNPQGVQRTRCTPYKELQGSSIAKVQFKILPLELGVHTINFTLRSSSISEILVKTLRVVPEGIRKELHEGYTLDPQGVYGTVKRQLEFRRRIPLNMVPKTSLERTVSVKGLLLGDVINAVVDPEGLKFLANLPKGSAETELMNVVPVFYVYDYLRRTDSWDILGQGSLTSELNMKRKMKEVKGMSGRGMRAEEAKNKAVDYLLQNVESSQSTFSLAIATYALALTRMNHPKARMAYSLLKREALVKVGQPTYRFWKESKGDSSIPSQSTARMVETTAYALLTTLLQGDKAYADPIMRWLSEQQRYGGGFYSTQDTVNALESLTEYSVLVRRLELDMNVKVAYKKYGDFHQYRLNRNHYVGQPVEASLEDDIEVRTGSNTGLAIVNLKSIYYKSSTSEDVCNFELKIDVKSGEKVILAGNLKVYKPPKSEPYSASSHTVMDISLVSGLEANMEDLAVLSNKIEPLIASYEVTDGHVLLQLDSVDKQCSMFYNPYGEESLVRLCEGAECKCMEAECGRMQAKLDQSISIDSRKDAACQSNIAYGKIRGAGAYQMQKALNPKENYLIMGKEALKIGEGVNARYQYPLDALTWIEWWPSEDFFCQSCQNFAASMEEFAEDLFLNGC